MMWFSAEADSGILGVQSLFKKRSGGVWASTHSQVHCFCNTVKKFFKKIMEGTPFSSNISGARTWGDPHLPHSSCARACVNNDKMHFAICHTIRQPLRWRTMRTPLITDNYSDSVISVKLLLRLYCK